MSVTGIIAEFNPLHSGHKHIIDCAKQSGNTVFCVISGNFVQRGDTSIISKQKRAEMALRCGADLVAELPVTWSMSTAQNFAMGGVWQLYNLGCDEILFGSECGDIEALKNTADILDSKEFSYILENELKSGITFAAARENAARALGADPEILKGANNNLGIEYICAAKRLNADISFKCIKREGAAHDSKEISNGFVSASLMREKILSGNIGFAERYMPIDIRGLIKEDNISDIKRLETAILSSLRCKTADNLKCLPDISEGLENKIFFASRVASNLDELYSKIKTKRYTLARIRRLVLSAFLGLDGEFFMKPPPYTRVLGFSECGAAALKNARALSPIITQVSQIKKLEADALKIFESECRASDLYALSFSVPRECGMEYKSKLLKSECLK